MIKSIKIVLKIISNLTSALQFRTSWTADGVGVEVADVAPVAGRTDVGAGGSAEDVLTIRSLGWVPLSAGISEY